jgi:hypothetical protein
MTTDETPPMTAAPTATRTHTGSLLAQLRAEGEVRDPDRREPDAERQAELRAAYDDNIAAGKPPYQDVPIRTLGEPQWVLRERDRSVDSPRRKVSSAPI